MRKFRNELRQICADISFGYFLRTGDRFHDVRLKILMVLVRTFDPCYVMGDQTFPRNSKFSFSDPFASAKIGVIDLPVPLARPRVEVECHFLVVDITSFFDGPYA